MADNRGLPLWIESGWALDARLKYVTREHGDIDIAFPENNRLGYESLLEEMGCKERRNTNYGFTVSIGDILVESEPCQMIGNSYSFANAPKNSCPIEKEGEIDGFKIRCVSWEYMYWEFLYLKKEVSITDWKGRHFADLEIIKKHLTPERIRGVETMFDSIQLN